MSHICRQCSAVGFVSYELVVVESTITAEYRCHRCGFSWRTAQNGEYPESSERAAADVRGEVYVAEVTERAAIGAPADDVNGAAPLT